MKKLFLTVFALLVFLCSCDSAAEADYIREIGADGAYVDFPSVLE